MEQLLLDCFLVRNFRRSFGMSLKTNGKEVKLLVYYISDIFILRVRQGTQ